MGSRNKDLNRIALTAVKKIGKVDIDYGETSCHPLDVIKHLTSGRVKKKINK